MNEVNAEQKARQQGEDARKLWVKAVEQMVENEKLKERIEFLERKIALDIFAGRTVH